MPTCWCQYYKMLALEGQCEPTCTLAEYRALYIGTVYIFLLGIKKHINFIQVSDSQTHLLNSSTSSSSSSSSGSVIVDT